MTEFIIVRFSKWPSNWYIQTDEQNVYGPFDLLGNALHHMRQYGYRDDWILKTKTSEYHHYVKGFEF
jgi:hypothetical protein